MMQSARLVVCLSYLIKPHIIKQTSLHRVYPDVVLKEGGRITRDVS